MKRTQHIPTLLALLLLILGLGGAVFLVENGSSFLTRAAGSSVPQEVRVANITDTSFTISWITQAPTRTVVKYTKQGLFSDSKSGYDTRDTNGTIERRQIHSVLVSDLEPLTGYEFEILSNNKTYREKSYLATTGPTLAIPTHVVDPAFGMIVDEEDKAIKEGLVYASFEGSQTVSSLVSNGSWIVPLGTLRSADGSRYFIPSKTDTEEFFFMDAETKASAITTIENDSPVPHMRLGETYDFRRSEESYVPGLIIAQAAKNESLSATVGTTTFQITSPEKDSGIPGSKPQFKGTGIAGKQVILTISGTSITPQSRKVVIDASGRWTWIPATALAPNKYTITASSVIADGTPKVLVQSFTILKSGTQVLQAATPSASLTPSPTPIASASPRPSFTTTPSATASPSSVPTTGTIEYTILALGAALILSIFGFVSLRPNQTT